MPAPTTSNELLELIRRSGILDSRRLDAHLEKLRQADSLPANAQQLAAILVRDGLLTNFQAEQFLQGKWKRFTIGKYKVLERLGAGGMGSVYLCEHTLMRRRVAVKVLPPGKASDPASLARFHREAQVVAALDHPNIVRAYDVDQDGNLHFLVMEHVDGASLQEMVKKTGPMEVTRACHYIRQAAIGLQHAHETARIVHRDIKPGNILVDRNGIVKVLDMGLARFFDNQEDDITRKYDENVLGTADYLAPEQALESHSADIRADIYSLGCTFYYCLTGRPPFADGTVAQKLIWHQTRKPPAVTTFRQDVPEGVLAILEKMMVKEPAQRYQTPLEVVEALTPWTQSPIPPPLDAEMPQLSPAALASGGREPSEPSSPTAISPTPRQRWDSSVSSSPEPLSGSTASSQQASASRRQPPERVSSTPGPTPASTTPAPPRPVSPPTPSPAQRSADVSPLMPPPPRPAPAPPSPPVPELLEIPTPALAHPAPTEELPWEKVVGETDDLSRSADTTPRTARGMRPAITRPSNRRTWILAGAVGLAAVLGVVIFLLIRGGSASTPATTTESRRAPLIVAADAPYRTLAAALARVQPRDQILVKQDLTEYLHLDADLARRLRGVKIQAQPEQGKKITWSPPPPGRGQSGQLPLIQLLEVDGLTLEGFTLNGEGRADSLVQLSAGCKDVLLKKLTLSKPRLAGIHFVNCAAEKPIILTGVQTEEPWPANIPALLFVVVKNPGVPERNSNIEIWRDCTFSPRAPLIVRGKHENLEFKDKDLEKRLQRQP